MTTPEQQAADPATPPSVLQQLAVSRPDLQVSILENPATYPGLVKWISEYGEPLARERAGQKLADNAARTQVVSPGTVPQRTSIRVGMGAQQPISAPPQSSAPPPASVPQSASVPPPISAPVAVSAAGPQATRSSTVPLWAWAIIGLLIAGLVAVFAVFLLLGKGTDNGDSDSGDAVTISDVAGEVQPLSDELESVKVEPSEDEIVAQEPIIEVDESLPPVETPVTFAAPSSAVSASWIVSPTGNIACELGSTTLACTVYSHDYPVQGAGCGSGPSTYVISEESAGWDCNMVPVRTGDQSPYLTYGTSTATGRFACQSEELGMSCWDTVDGRAIALSRQDWMSGMQGQIQAFEFRWG